MPLIVLWILIYRCSLKFCYIYSMFQNDLGENIPKEHLGFAARNVGHVFRLPGISVGEVQLGK